MDCIWQRWLAAMLLGSLIFLAWVCGHPRAKPESGPAGGPIIIARHLTAGSAGGDSQAMVAGCAPSVDVVPSQDGTALFIGVGGFESCGTICVNTNEMPDLWPVRDQRCCATASCVITVSGLTPGTTEYGRINITSTLGLDMVVDFVRAYVPASAIQTIDSLDGNLQLTLVSTDTIAADTYVAVISGHIPPGLAPLGHRLVGNTYSVRAAGALLVADRPMSLRFCYDEAALAGADPHNLAIFAWDAFHRRWDDWGGRLFYDQRCLAVATSRFTTYALMTAPAWRDDFNDSSGIDSAGLANVTFGGLPDDLVLVLENVPGSGSAVSQPISPTAAITRWDSVTFTRVVDPPTTTLSVDVLGLDGTELLTDVASGVSLAGLDPARYPVLKLQATLSSAVAGKTPALEAWQLAWGVRERSVYLPMVSRWRQ
jgi:hypothetical protein